MSKVDYLVSQIEPYDDTTEEFVLTLREAKALAKKQAKKTNALWQIVKFVDEVPADFERITYWYVDPKGNWRTQ